MRPICLMLLGFSAACGNKASSKDEATADVVSSPAKIEAKTAQEEMPPAERGPLGSVRGVGLQLSDFDALSGAQKMWVQAAVDAVNHAESVNFAMAGAEVLRCRRVLSGILKAKKRVPLSIRKKLEPYARRFFLNVGPIDVFTGERILPGFIPGELAAAAKAAIDSGVDLGVDEFDGVDLGANRLEQLEAMLASVHPVIFGTSKKAHKKTEHKKTDTDGVDDEVLRRAMADMAAPIEKYLANIDESKRPPYDVLVRYAKAIDGVDFNDFVNAYLNAPQGEVVLFVGPIGPARQVATGAAPLYRFEGLVAIKEQNQSRLLEKLSREIPYFERRIPGNAMFRRSKKQIVLPVAATFNLASAAPFGAIALPYFRLPAPNLVGEGRSKVMLFTNVLDAEDRLFGEVAPLMFAKEGVSAGRLSKWRRAAATAFWSMKSVVGFELGTRKESGGDLKYQTDVLAILAEMHADLATLYFVFDPKAHSIGLVPEPECAAAVIDSYLARFLMEAPIDADPATRVGRSVIARRLVVRQLLNKYGVSVVKEDGHYVIHLFDEAALRKGIEALLGDAQRMVSTRESKSGGALLEEKGGALPLTWQKDIKNRLRAHGVPRDWTFIYPRFEKVVRGKDGALLDITLKNAAVGEGR